MTKFIFILSALFLLSIVFKSNIERPVQPSHSKVADAGTWSDKVTEISDDLNALLASEQTEAGQPSPEQNKQQAQPKITVKEEVVDVAKYETAFANDKVEKLVADLSSTAASESGAKLASTKPAVAESATASLPVAKSFIANSDNASSPSNASSNTSAENAKTTKPSSAKRASGSVVPLAFSPLKTPAQADGVDSKLAQASYVYYVQYGIFSSACRCEQVKKQLSQAGIEAVMDNLDLEGKQWIVKSKSYSSRAEAIYSLQAAQRKGYEGYLVTAN